MTSAKAAQLNAIFAIRHTRTHKHTHTYTHNHTYTQSLSIAHTHTEHSGTEIRAQDTSAVQFISLIGFLKLLLYFAICRQFCQ